MKSKPEITISKKIELARREKDWTQEKLAEETGVHRVTIVNYEQSEENITDFIILKKIAAALGKPLSFFVSEETQIPLGITPEQLEILNDPVFRRVIMPAFKNKKEIKNAIVDILECLPSLTPEKRQAILALCK
ncbi:MAG: helix-turn-helix transcriptional regulator [Candidatus Omnitrophica bacterium]|nr:helix-turn-helix transcriptional regulator [Candidatus Omnitrophota bacterium]